MDKSCGSPEIAVADDPQKNHGCEYMWFKRTFELDCVKLFHRSYVTWNSHHQSTVMPPVQQAIKILSLKFKRFLLIKFLKKPPFKCTMGDNPRHSCLGNTKKIISFTLKLFLRLEFPNKGTIRNDTETQAANHESE
ncbi:hypothetical protein NPIL_418881 [Nephila pilipes]|uniref:Uncharacterized protein n=1 Tax=Nephila pilipes TaxID=299642 RepID=A0A8X6JZX1_NEPPI|nr:hypothetical protein NPIL_418881 [Nephila pilipes]